MSDPFDGKQFPTGILYAAAAMVSLAMVLTLMGQTAEVGTVRVPEADIAYQVEVRFADHGSSGVDVIDAGSGELITRVTSGEDGFVRGVLRGMNRTRKLEGLGPEAPFRLVRWTDGRISLSDTLTKRSVELRGFGATNLRAFSKLLAAAENRS